VPGANHVLANQKNKSFNDRPAFGLGPILCYDSDGMSTEDGFVVTRFQISAGGVVYRLTPNQDVEVVLIAHRKGESWRLPKGRIEAGETLHETALREVTEETGLTTEILEELRPIEYSFWWYRDKGRVRYHKKVYFYLMSFVEGDFALHDAEVADVRWMPISRATCLVAYRQEQEVLDLARERISQRHQKRSR